MIQQKVSFVNYTQSFLYLTLLVKYSLIEEHSKKINEVLKTVTSYSTYNLLSTSNLFSVESVSSSKHSLETFYKV